MDSRWKRSSADGFFRPPTGAFPVAAALDDVRKVLPLHHVGELDLAGFLRREPKSDPRATGVPAVMQPTQFR